MSYFSTPLSGLNASSAALQSISNNLANMNTDGYKTQSTSFSDVFYQNYGTNGSGEPLQAGLGVQVSGTEQDLTNGPISSTGNNANMALDGAGLFVVQSSPGALAYTRSGDFTTNTLGQLSTSGGQLLMGYPAVNGTVSTNVPLQPINVGSGMSSPAQATSSFQITANLDSTANVGDTYNSPIKVYDSLGANHMLTIQYTKTAANQWSFDVSLPSSEIQGGTGTSTSVGSGSLSFDSSGALISPSSPVTTINVGPLADGAATLKPAWVLQSTSLGSTLTQTANPSSNNASTQDGFAAGSLRTFSVLKDGSVQATFTNGQNRIVAQVAVASFANPQGLHLSGDNLYQNTFGSGDPVIGTAGTGGRGAINGASVEQSNVDVAKEFAKMIVAQRSYEANAKAITAFDQIEQATIQMKS